MKKQAAPFEDAIPKYDMGVSHPLTKDLARLNTRATTTKEKAFGTTSVSFNAVSATIKGQMGVAQAQLFDYINTAFINQPNHEKAESVTFSLKQYAEDKGAASIASARKSLKRNYSILKTASFTYRHFNYQGKEDGFSDIILFPELHIMGRGANAIVVIALAPTYRMILNDSYVTPYPKEMWKIDPKKHGTEYNIISYLAYNKRVNMGNPTRENRARVETILKYCNGTLPTVEDVKKEDRAYTRRIIEPFFREADLLQESKVINYHFETRDGLKVSDDYLSSISYNEFKELYIVVDIWFDYPRNKIIEIVNQRAEYQKAAKRKRKEQEKKKLLQNN